MSIKSKFDLNVPRTLVTLFMGWNAWQNINIKL